MKFCNRCGLQRLPGADDYIGALRFPETYGAHFNCRNCSTTYLLLIWEAEEDDDVLLDGDLREVTNRLSDLRSEAAA